MTLMIEDGTNEVPELTLVPLNVPLTVPLPEGLTAKVTGYALVTVKSSTAAGG